MKLDILAFAAHPDDIELSCSGTILKHINLGYKVGIVDLNQRRIEYTWHNRNSCTRSEVASAILGIHYRKFGV